jgi:hypothetical protein
VCFQHPLPLLGVSFQFIVYSVFCLGLVWFGFFFAGRGVSLPGGYAGLSQGWLWEYCVMLGAHLLVCQMSPKQVWSLQRVAWEPSCFFSVTWHREALYVLGVQGVKALIPLGALFLPSVAPVSQQDF